MNGKEERRNKLSEGMERLFDLFVLNFWFLLCSIPIVTVGAALTALHRVLLQCVRGEDAYQTRDFFRAFRREFRQSTVLWLPMLAAAVVLYLDQAILLPGLEGAFRAALFFASLFFEVILLVLLIYAFPLQARYENPVRQTVKNALLMGVWKFPRTIAAAACHLALPLVYAFVPSAQPVVMILYFVCGFSVPLLLADTVLNSVFRDVIPEERALWEEEGDEDELSPSNVD